MISSTPKHVLQPTRPENRIQGGPMYPYVPGHVNTNLDVHARFIPSIPRSPPKAKLQVITCE